jgi:transposase
MQRQLAATRIPPDATLVVLEATSSYWVALAVSMDAAGYAASVVNPSWAHHRAKTDALDAQNLARLSAALQPDRWTHPPAVYHDAAQRHDITHSVCESSEAPPMVTLR